MASIGSSTLKALVDNAPQSATSQPMPPWTNATPDRLLKTTATTVLLNMSPDVILAGEWDQNCAPFSAVSPPDPTTGQQYFCIVNNRGFRFDYGLNLAVVPGTPPSEAGRFSSQPLLQVFSAYAGWAYAIDSATGSHYFLCAGVISGSPNSLYWSPLNETFTELPPLMHQYKPQSAVVQPQGLWATGETIWFNNSDGSLWQVALADVITNGNASLKQVDSTGVVQAVISDEATSPTYYVLSAIPNGSSYDLVEFPAGDPGSAVTIQSGWTPGGIKTTPDGAVWHVIPDLNSTIAPTSAQVSLLCPPFPANGQTPTWIDPFANADPAFYPAGTTQTIMDAVPLSATNILLRTTTDYAAEHSGDWSNWSARQMTRVGIGVIDQPAIPFPSYEGDAAQVYTYISQQLIDSQSPNPSQSYDIRSQYASLTSSEADSYYTNVKTMSKPATITDLNAWNQVQGDLINELYNLVWTLAFWEQTGNLVNLQSQAQGFALKYVSDSLAIPTTATLLNTNAGNVNALTLVGAGLGAGGSVLAGVSTVLGACTFPVGSVFFGLLSVGSSLASIFCATKASRETNYVIDVSDPMYQISAKLGDIDKVLGPLFSGTLSVIGSSVEACATDLGRLATIGGLVRNQIWTNTTPKFDPNASQTPESFSAFYNACVVTFFAAFVPLVTAVNVIMTNPNAGGTWATYKGKPVYVSPTHTFTDSLNEVYNGALLQYASAKDQSKPLGQDLDALLFTTWQIPYADVFLQWGIPPTPSWIS